MKAFAPLPRRGSRLAADRTNVESASPLNREIEPQQSPFLKWSFRNIGVEGALPPVSMAALSRPAFQRKLVVNEPGDQYEQEADRVAEQVMRMPEPGVPQAKSSFHVAPVVQRKCAQCEEEEKLQRKCAKCEEEQKLQRKEAGTIAEPDFAPPIVHEALQSAGDRLDPGARAYFEPRFGYDFNRVRIHTGSKAAESAQSMNALAYTVGQDIVFGSGQYSAHTSGGRQLLAHELAHTVQQAGPMAQRVQRTEKVTLKLKGRAPLTVVIGGLRFTKDAIDDVLKAGALLPSADQAHIGFKGDQLGYDPNYTAPTDPYRWNKLKEIIDSDAKIQVKKVGLLGTIKVLFITPKGRAVIEDNMRQLGLTLPTETLSKTLDPTATTMTVSPSADTHTVLYTTEMGSPADSSMAHELFGHMWLALKGVPWQHPSKPADIKARGTLSAQHGIRDPFGNIYTGTVQDYIDRYAGSERGMLASPTQNVGTQLLQSALTAFQANFNKGATGTLNGPWKVPSDADTQWEIISTNYVLAPAPQPPSPAPTPVPATTPAPKSTAPQTGTPANAPALTPAPATAPSVTQASIEQEVGKFYKSLNADKQYVFIRFLQAVQIDMQRRTQLASQMLKTLTKPSGMNSPTEFVP
jgi:hypothetical protein